MNENVIASIIKSLPTKVARRIDGWVNTVTGFGSSLTDKVASTVPGEFRGLPPTALADMFNGDAIVRKAVSLRPAEALRLGVGVTVPDEAGGVEASTAIQDAIDDLQVVSRFSEACAWENLFGGCVIVLGLDDGQSSIDSQANPVAWNRLRKIVWLKVVDNRRVFPSWVDSDMDLDPMSPTYGEPLYYLLTLDWTTGRFLRIHRDRLIVFPGLMTTEEERRKRRGWGVSVLDPVFESLQRNTTAWQSAGNSLANAQYVVYRLKGLAHMFGMPDGEAKAKARARAMEMAKSMINAVLIDSEDEYLRENPNFGNMPHMLDQFMLDVCAHLDIPASKLWGRSPAGMNATGEGDENNWLASVETYRTQHLRPRLEQFITLLLSSKEGPTAGAVPDGWRVSFESLKQLSKLEQADLRLKTSQADAIDIDKGILLPQEVAKSRYRPEGYSTDTTIDLDVRERLLRLELDARERGLSGVAEKDTGEEPTDKEEDAEAYAKGA